MDGLTGPALRGNGSAYLAGAIEYAPDGGKAWRREIGEFLRTNCGIRVFDPCVNEFALLTPEEKDSFRHWKSGNPVRFRDVIRRIIDHDLQNLLERTGLVVCYWDEHATRGAGTAGELTVAYLHGIPVHMVLGMPRAGVSSWALGCAAEVYNGWDDFRNRFPGQSPDPRTFKTTNRMPAHTHE